MQILFIQTGGTIDKDYREGALSYNFEIMAPAIERILAQINPSFSYAVKSVLKKDSLNITDEDRQIIFKACQEAEENYIIITHGTDTMDKTAQVLTNIPDKTIVLTGSLRPERFTNSDASFNIGSAIGALGYCQPGVYIAMSGRVLPWDKISKDPKTGQFIKQ